MTDTNNDLFNINNLEKVDFPVLLVAGTLDQVAPVSEMIRIHNELPNSRLAIFEAYHSLQSSAESKKCRSELANTFFHSADENEAVREYLERDDTPCKFLELLE